MGLFGWGKKKPTQTDTINETFSSFGAATNEIKQPEKVSRSDMAKDAEMQRKLAQQKDQILNSLMQLRKFMFNKPEFSDYYNAIEDAIFKFKSMPDNEDKASMVAVDNFILEAIKDGIDYCNKSSWVGMGACIDVIGDLINDRFRCGAWFKEPEYIKARLTSNKIYAEVKDLEARVTTINERGAALLAKYDDPKFKAQRQSIENELVKLKNDRENYNARINSLNTENQLLQKTINTIEADISSRTRDAQFDIQSQVDSVIEKQHDASARNYANEKMLDKLNNVGTRHTDSAMTVDGNLSSAGVETPKIDVHSLGF